MAEVVVYVAPAGSGTPPGAAAALGQEDPLEEEMAAHSSILAWDIKAKPSRQ